MYKFRIGDKVIPTKRARKQLYNNEDGKFEPITIIDIQKRYLMYDLLVLDYGWEKTSIYIDCQWVTLNTRLGKILYGE